MCPARAAAPLQEFGIHVEHCAGCMCCPVQAFMEAIDAIGRQGTLLIPAGRYLIRQQLNINNRVVLRGGF